MTNFRLSAETHTQFKNFVTDIGSCLTGNRVVAPKGAKIKLDLEHDQAEIWGNTVDLDCTSSGHYCVSLEKQTVTIDQCLFTDSKVKTYEEKQEILH